MAGKVSGGFVTGANARVKLGKNVLAYCTDVSYNMDIQTIPVESMGSLEVHANEPVALTVNGSFSVVRYTKNLGKTTANPTPAVAAADGNTAEHNGIGTHLDPAAIISSGTFDLEVQTKTSDSPGGATEMVSIYKISDCRITNRRASLNKRGVLVDQYAFVGVIAGDTKADGSGIFAADSSFEDLNGGNAAAPATTNVTGVTK